MKEISEYIVRFSGLKLGKHNFNYKIGEEFMELFTEPDFNHLDVEVDVELDKKDVMLELFFNLKGKVSVPCDRCMDMLDIEASGDHRLIVKFGDGEYYDHDDIKIIPQDSHQLDLKDYIYEFISLLLPAKRVHEEGECNPEMINTINEHAFDEKEEKIDPRWKALKGLSNSEID